MKLLYAIPATDAERLRALCQIYGDRLATWADGTAVAGDAVTRAVEGTASTLLVLEDRDWDVINRDLAGSRLSNEIFWPNEDAAAACDALERSASSPETHAFLDWLRSVSGSAVVAIAS